MRCSRASIAISLLLLSTLFACSKGESATSTPDEEKKTPTPTVTAAEPESRDTATAASRAADGTPSDEPAFRPASGSTFKVPLVTGLRLVAARHEPGRGDYEPMVTVTEVTNTTAKTRYSAELPDGERIAVDRTVRRQDLETAGGYRPFFNEGDPEVFAGTTAFSVSSAVLNDLKTKGETELTRFVPPVSPLAQLSRLFGGKELDDSSKQAATLRRVEPHAVGIPVLLNDDAVELPAIHARGTFGDEVMDFYVLDDPDNPLMLRAAGRTTGRIVRIAYPVKSAVPALEEKLKTESRVELHGIYFDFSKATIKPESEPVLRDIAAALTRNPEWKINIEGHTDNVGGDAMNLDLSRRRADAVKQALVERYRVSATGLTTAGFGVSRPRDSNDTLSGRARNRRVELVRQ